MQVTPAPRMLHFRLHSSVSFHTPERANVSHRSQAPLSRHRRGIFRHSFPQLTASDELHFVQELGKHRRKDVMRHDSDQLFGHQTSALHPHVVSWKASKSGQSRPAEFTVQCDREDPPRFMLDR
jgi:hypothetical protein